MVDAVQANGSDVCVWEHVCMLVCFWLVVRNQKEVRRKLLAQSYMSSSSDRRTENHEWKKKRMEGYRDSRSVKAMQGRRSLMKLWSTVSSFEDKDVRCPALRLMLMWMNGRKDTSSFTAEACVIINKLQQTVIFFRSACESAQQPCQKTLQQPVVEVAARTKQTDTSIVMDYITHIHTNTLPLTSVHVNCYI